MHGEYNTPYNLYFKNSNKHLELSSLFTFLKKDNNHQRN